MVLGLEIINRCLLNFSEPTSPHGNGITSQNTEEQPLSVPVSPEPVTPSAPPAIPEDEPGRTVSESATSQSVSHSVPPPAVTAATTSRAPTPSARAMFDFDGETGDDISFKVKKNCYVIWNRTYTESFIFIIVLLVKKKN